MEDIFQHAGLVTRKVEKRNHDKQNLYAIISESVYDTDILDLWDAITNKERLPRWFAPVQGDLNQHGHYQIKDNASGKITHCEKPKGFELTWEFGADLSWVKVELISIEKDKTQLRLEHLAHAEGEHFKLYGPGAGGVGWDLGLAGLRYHVKTKESVPSENELIVTSDYKDFISFCSKEWGMSAIKAGFDREMSLMAAKKTEQFYLGET